MYTIYVYVLDTLADWEIGYVTAELHSGRFFKKDAPRLSLKTVSDSKLPILTMGGLTIMPDCSIDDMVISETSVLVLPGADTWNDPKHGAIIEKSWRISLFRGDCVCNLRSDYCPCQLRAIGSSSPYQ